MNLLSFFPSRTLGWYMGKMFVVRSFAILAMLVVILQTLDLLGESGRILAHPGNGNPEILRYVSLRVPQIIQTFLPFSVLLGTLLTLVTLNQNSEVVAMKAGGMSAHQILAPLWVAALFIALISFTFNDRIVSRATAYLDSWSKLEFAPVPPDSGMRSNVWVRDGNNLVSVGSVSGRGATTTLTNVEIFGRRNNQLVAIVRSERATLNNLETGQWRLVDATRFETANGQLRQLGTVNADLGIAPDRFTLANVNGDGLSFADLRSAVIELQAAGRPTQELETILWHKIVGPMSALLMPLLGAVAGFGLARSGKLLVRAVIGMGLGFTYFVADNFGLAMGSLGAYPPWLAACGPFLLFFLIGELVLIRTEE